MPLTAGRVELGGWVAQDLDLALRWMPANF